MREIIVPPQKINRIKKRNKMNIAEEEKEQLLREIKHLREKITLLESNAKLNNAGGVETGEAEEYPKEILEHNLTAVFRTNVSGKLIACNDAYAKLFGYDSSQEIKSITSVTLYFNPADREKYLKNLYKNKKLNNYKLRLKRKDGREIWVLVNVILYDCKESGENLLEGSLIDITETQKAEIALKKSEERFRMLAENAYDIVYRYSFIPTPGYEYVSPSVLDITGYSPEEFYSDPYLGFNIIHPDDVPQIGDSKSKIKERKEVKAVPAVPVILRWITKSGKIIWTETRSRPIYDANGKITALEGISRDITERKLAEQEIIASEERFRILSNATFEGIVFSENGKIIDTNDQVVQMFGFDSREELIGRNLIEEFVVNDQIEHAKKLLRLPKSETFEVRVKKKDGSIITVETKGQAIPYIGRNIKATIIYDISKRKKNEKDLRENERALAALMEHLPGMAYRCLYDESWTMNFVSQGCYDLTGYFPKDLVDNGKLKFSDLIHPDDRQLGKDEIEAAISTHTPFEIEYRIITADKRIKWVWEKGEGVFNETGMLLFLEGFITDITDKKEQEQKLEASRENYKNLTELSPDGIYILGDNDRIVFANKSALKMLGLNSLYELNNKTIYDYILPEYHEKVKHRRILVDAGEDLLFIDIVLKQQTGKILEVETKPIKFFYGGKPAIQVVMHDISFRRQLEREQMRAQIAEETNAELEKEIAERKNSERTLRVTQKYTRLLIDSSLDMICASDKNGYINEFNAAAQRMFGYSLQEALGKRVDMLYANPADRINIVDKQLSITKNFSGEIKGKRKTGQIFTAYLSASVLRNESGETIGAMGVLRDITEIKNAQTQLEQSEERYRDLFENATDLIHNVDIPGNIIYVNDAWKKTLGYSDADIKKLNIFKIIHPESQEHFLRIFERISKGETVDKFEIALVTKASTTILVEGNISLKMQAGKPVSTRGIFRNITEKRKAEEEIKIQSMKLNAVIESSSHLIWTVADNIRLTSFNKNYSDFIQRTNGMKPFVGMEIADILDLKNERNEFWTKKYSNALGGASQDFEVSVVDSKGATIWLEIYLHPIQGQGTKAIEVSCIGHDITEKKTNEEKVKQSLKEKEVLLKEVHHRVKNNLQVISSILNLQSSYVKDKKIIEMFKESQNRIKSMAFIHESLYQTKDFSNINFSEYITNLSRNLVGSYTNLDHTVKLNIKIEKVFLNLDQAIPCGLIINELITNSLKYAFPDKRKGHITVEIKQENEKMKLSIGDNGIGLSKKVDYRNTESLGLQLVVTLVDQLGGTIELAGKRGTKFIIKFKHKPVKN